MEKLITYIEKNQSKKFIDRLNTLLKDPSFDINQTFLKKDPKYSLLWLCSFFSYSCLYGNLEICKHLLSKGADPTGKESDFHEGLPLVKAVLHNQFHISDWLQKTLDVDCSINNSWPLKMSAYHGNLSGVKYALNHNADIHTENDEALRYAAENGHLEVVKYLLSEGADIHAKNDSALRCAIWYDQFKTAEHLLDHGANPNAKDEDGYILQWLVKRDQLKLAAKAVSYGADITVLPPDLQARLQEYISSHKEELNASTASSPSRTVLEKAKELQESLEDFLASAEKEASYEKETLAEAVEALKELKKETNGLKEKVEGIDSRITQLLESLEAFKPTDL